MKANSRRTSTTYTGKQIFLETLRTEGVRYVFGNPGTTELPLIDGLLDYPDIDYILTLHEAVAVSMADAFAHASATVGVVNLHVAPGLGNGLGSVYNAWEGQTPLLVTAGQQDTRLRLREPLLSHDLVAMAKPLVKWSVEAQSADELPLLLNRAFKTARETPSGPVFVSLPMNVMEQTTARAPLAPSALFPASAPDAQGLERAVEYLLAGERPVILCGDKVSGSGAIGALVNLAERIGASVYYDVLPARVNFPTGHPHFQDRIARDQAHIHEILGDADTILMIGGEFFEEIWHVDAWPFPEDARLIQIDPAAANVGRNYPVDCGLVADPRRAIEAIDAAIEAQAGAAYREAARARREHLGAAKAAAREAQAALAQADTGNRAMSAARLMAELRAAAPEDVSIAGEAITATPDLMRSFDFQASTDYLGPRGGGIGQGLPSAIGVQLALPERPVLCVSGDGSALYTIQALWTAAHHAVPVVYVILKNRTYKVLKLNMNRYRAEAGIDAGRAYPHLDLSAPEVDYVDIARGFGVRGARIEKPQDVGPAVKAAFASGEPWLLEVIVDGEI